MVKEGMLGRYKWGNFHGWKYVLIVKKLSHDSVLVFYEGKLRKVYIDGIEKMKQLDSWEVVQCL